MRLILIDVKHNGQFGEDRRIIEIGVSLIEEKLRQYYPNRRGILSQIISQPYEILDENWLNLARINNILHKDKLSFESVADKLKKYFINSILIGFDLENFELPLLKKEFDIIDKEIDDMQYFSIKDYLLREYEIKASSLLDAIDILKVKKTIKSSLTTAQAVSLNLSLFNLITKNNNFELITQLKTFHFSQ
jgi:hypothetical protein